jgi:hypothetical protein
MVRIVVVVLSFFILSGCGSELSSTKRLLSFEKASSPDQNGRYILIQFKIDAGDELDGSLLEDVSHGQYLYQGFDPTDPNKITSKSWFYEVPNLFSFFTGKKFIYTVYDKKKKKYGYAFLKKDREGWTYYSPKKDVKFNTYQQLISEINNVEEDTDYNPDYVEYINIKSIDATTASLFKQVAIQ